MRLKSVTITAVLTLFMSGYFVSDSSTASDNQGLQAKQLCNLKALSHSVQTASTELETIRSAYARSLKNQLKKLKHDKGWTDQEFILKARPLIDNEKLNVFRSENKRLVASISDLGQISPPREPDCEMLVRLNSRLRKIIKNTRDQWEFMLTEIHAATKSGP